MSKKIKKQIVICCFSPTHLISSVSAIRCIHDIQNVRVTIIVHWPGVKERVNREICQIVKTLSHQFSFIKKIIPVSEKDLSQVWPINTRQVKKNLRKMIGENSYEEIYYSHDVVGLMYQFLSQLYPSARRICYGDGLGIVYEQDYHLFFLEKHSIWERLKFKYFRKSNTLWPDQAILILPVDQSGNFLKNVTLKVVPKKIVNQTLNKCISSARDLRIYIEKLLQTYKGKNKFLLLTDNIAEGNFIDFDKEIEMWCSIIREYCRQGDIIFLKSHPGEFLPRNQKIKKKLKEEFEIVILEKKFKRYPIEIWKKLINECEVISISYPILSLKYLYNVNVINPVNNQFIEKWFPEWTWKSFRNSNSLYMEPLKRLKNWDGQSILWSGKNK